MKELNLPKSTCDLVSSKEFLLQKTVDARSRELTDWLVLIISLWVVGLSMFAIVAVIWAKPLLFWQPIDARVVSLILLCFGSIASVAAFSNMKLYRKEKSQYLKLLDMLTKSR
jgi:phosphoglycerol transferase MdoB-like AlkP superfamily enzyme